MPILATCLRTGLNTRLITIHCRCGRVPGTVRDTIIVLPLHIGLGIGPLTTHLLTRLFLRILRAPTVVTYPHTGLNTGLATIRLTTGLLTISLAGPVLGGPLGTAVGLVGIT